MNPPLVSIIIAAYRADRWLDAALESARAQTHRNLEIIVVDDGSPDETAAHVESHIAVDSRVRLIRLPQNGGQSKALNHGFSQSQGDYIKFFDADDIISPDMVARQVQALEGTARRIAHGEWARFTTNPNEAVFNAHPGWHDGDPVDWIVETWRDTEPMYQCALWLIPRALLETTGGWDTSLTLVNDFEFFTRVVLASGGVCFTPGARLYYRSNLPGSVSDLKSNRAIQSGWRSVSQAISHLLAAEDSPRTRRVSADIAQSFVHAYYPSAPETMRAALGEVRRLGGSQLKPQGGVVFRTVCRVLGWRIALRVRQCSSRKVREKKHSGS